MGFLDGLDEEYAPSWKPEPGDIADGIITRINKRDGKWGPYPVITIRRIVNEQPTTTEVAIHMQGRVLQDWCEAEGPAKGDRIAVRYNGQKSGKDSGMTYRDYNRTLAKAAELDSKFRLDAFGMDAPAAAAVAQGGSATVQEAPRAGDRNAPVATPAPATGEEPW